MPSARPSVFSPGFFLQPYAALLLAVLHPTPHAAAATVKAVGPAVAAAQRPRSDERTEGTGPATPEKEAQCVAGSAGRAPQGRRSVQSPDRDTRPATPLAWGLREWGGAGRGASV